MLARLDIELENDEINYKMSSNLQGVIYENIEPEYVEEMHSNRLHPYSQYLTKENGKSVWHIAAVTGEAYKNIIIPLQDDSFNEIKMKNGKCSSRIIKKSLITESNDELMREFSENKGERYIDIEFLTPASFRQNNRNIIFPDLRLIYQSLMNKYSMSSDSIDMFDEDTLNQLVCNSEIVRYNLHSMNFPMEGVWIPGFCGKISIKFHGTDTMCRYIRLLCRFGEYSGVGIKTAMGMGAMKITDWRKKDG